MVYSTTSRLDFNHNHGRIRLSCHLLWSLVYKSLHSHLSWSFSKSWGILMSSYVFEPLVASHAILHAFAHIVHLFGFMLLWCLLYSISDVHTILLWSLHIWTYDPSDVDAILLSSLWTLFCRLLDACTILFWSTDLSYGPLDIYAILCRSPRISFCSPSDFLAILLRSMDLEPWSYQTPWPHHVNLYT